MKTLKDLGESGWLSKLHNLGVDVRDDCAVISPGTLCDPQLKRNTLITMDSLNEGVHFWRNKISAEDLGFKSLAVNLSDIAAMGGTPHSAFLSVSLASDLTEDWLDQFLVGVRSLLNQYNVKLLGGDTNGTSRDLSITWLVIGESPVDQTKLRSTAQPGDILAVTGALGDSAMGLECLKRGFSESGSKYVESVLNSHWRPRPQIEEGVFLGQHGAVCAMMDLSDGLWLDLPKLCKASLVGATVDIEKLPVSSSLKTLAREWSLNEREIAASGGEDYVLLFTAAAEEWDNLAIEFRERFERELYPIGRIEPQQAGVNFLKNNNIFTSNKSFNHF